MNVILKVSHHTQRGRERERKQNKLMMEQVTRVRARI
jgi:hypothetical protein